MPFTPLPQAKRGGHRLKHNDVTVIVGKPPNGSAVTTIMFPRSVLRAAGLPDYPGAKIEVLVGSGDDFGSLCIRAGGERQLRPYGNGETRVQVSFSGIAATKLGTTRCSSDAGNKALVVNLPAAFPWSAEVMADVVGKRVVEVLESQTLGAAA